MKEEAPTPTDSIKPEDSGSQSSEKSKKLPATRRRTKTGCMTCRTRRIKCDEARPTCKNCTKSRRECQGYQPSTRVPTMAPAMDDYAVFPPILTYPHQLHNPAEWHQTSLNPSTILTTSVSPPGAMYAQYPAETQQHSRYDWTIQSDLSGMAGYDPSFAGMYPDYAHGPRSASHIAAVLPQTSQSIHYSPYPDHPTAGTHTDDIKSSSRSFQPSVHQYQHQRLPTYFHSFSFASYDEDPDDPWDIETADGYPWYHLGMAMQRRAAPAISPILQERNALLLHHFINFLRPCVCLYERRPILDRSGRIKSAWGSTLPSAAISHPALGHAILGLSALHLAILYGNSDATARKHVLRSTKSMGKLLGDPSQRHRIEVLACVLLLAFFEVMDADHSKWVMHLSGAALFLNSEHDWAGMTRTIYRMRARAQVNLNNAKVGNRRMSWSDHIRIAGIPEALLGDEDWEVDQKVVSTFTGHDIDYLNCYSPDAPSEYLLKDFTPQEAEEVVTKMELFWWLTKQLVFQSLLSGDPLLAPYEKLLFCPPRGRLGSNLIGTVDHLWLILARLADFGGRDRLRKQRHNETGGQTVSAKVASTTKPTSRPSRIKKAQQDDVNAGKDDSNANEERTRMSKVSKPLVQGSGPKMFYGMVPPATVPTSMMHSFHVMDAQLHKNSTVNPTHTEASKPENIDKQTADALSEHALIGEALNVWRRSLGDQYQPLQPPAGDELTTPFGPAIRFNDPVVACSWAFYYLARIMLQRFHPRSPPAMIISAIANANATKDDAFAMLRIYWGVLYDQKQMARQGSINPTIVAALQELSFPLIFVAVHVEQAHQRAALIESLTDMEREAGWKSASASASACETFWSKMAQSGKGPPYERTVSHASSSGARRSDQKIRSSAIISHYNQGSEYDNRFVSRDRELIDKYAELRTYWALGMLSLDEDLAKMSLSR